MARRCIYSLSLFVCHQPSTAAPQQQYADSGMMAPPPPPFFYGSCWIFHHMAIFQSQTAHLVFFSQWVEKVREDVLEVRERERRAEDGRREEEKLGTKEMQRKMKRRNKKTKTKVLPVPQLQLHHPPSLLSRPPGRPLRLLRSHSLLRRLTVLVLPDRMICHFITNW